MNMTDSSGTGSASTGSEISRNHLQELSQSLARRWTDVARNLDMEEDKIESIEQSHPRDQVKASMEMLVEWKKSSGKSATYAKMAKALEMASRKDLAEKVEGWKRRQDSASEGVSREVSEKVSSRDASDASKPDLFPRYEMRNVRGRHRGICLLLTYENFSGPELAKRKGNKTDIDNLKEIFETLNFDVRSKCNLDSEATKSWINRMAEMDHQRYDCFVLFICSHGDKDTFATSDGENIVIQDVLTPFKVDNCPSLANKPKIFFFNSCRGDDGQELIRLDGPNNRGPCADVESFRPNEADFCVVLTTVPGYVAIRNVERGTYYVQSLYKSVETKKYYLKNHLIDILTLVNKDLNETLTERKIQRQNQTICQVSTIISTLDKAVYFS